MTIQEWAGIESLLKTVFTVAGTIFAMLAFFARRLDTMITAKVREQLRELSRDLTASSSQEIRELRTAMEEARQERRDDMRGVHERLDKVLLDRGRTR
jgi:signal transduction histidine kinase